MTNEPYTEGHTQPYVEGRGELIRAKRNYMGLDPSDLATLFGFRSDNGARHIRVIESNRRGCPADLYDRLDEYMNEFDAELDAAMAELEDMRDPVEITIEPDDSILRRAARGRAAVEYGNITPIIVGGVSSQERKAG